MKISNRSRRFPVLLMIALLASVWGVFPANLSAAEPVALKNKPGDKPQLFASPEDAVKALQEAAQSNNETAKNGIFGPKFRELLTGDQVLDAKHAKKFAELVSQGCKLVKVEEGKMIIELGTNGWPMAIPLVKANGQWYFDTAAGEEEIIDRHIGKDELHAIGVCRAYVTAQRQYASLVGGGMYYAQKFKSTPGKKDGLYWPVSENQLVSPFGPLVAEAHAEGYGRQKGKGPHPFHGYYFKILTRQGKAAPGGKMNYMKHGDLTGGFALVAYPERWDKSGVMTFIVNQSGQVFQQDLGEKTSRIAGTMKEYNPDSHWTLVQEGGILNAVSEK
jgi:hypothetical protein